MKSKIKHTILWYLLISFAAAIALEFGFGTRGIGDYFLYDLSLYIPALSVVVLYVFRLRKPIFKSKELGLSLKGWKYWILAPLYITSMCLLSYGISIFLNPGLLKGRDEIISGLTENGFYFGDIGLGLTAIALINAFLGALVSIPLYLGQELGWRAFLLPQLLKIFKPFPAFILGGLLWGLWSFLFMEPLFSDSFHPLIGCFLTILFCIPLGVLFQYFYFKSQSIFLAALAHGALYKSIDTASLFLSQEEMSAQAFGLFGISGLAFFGAMALFIFNKINWQTKNTYHE